MLIITGKKHRTAAIIALESCVSSPNQLLKIGAKAMIGMELAATAKGISRVPHRRLARGDRARPASPGGRRR